METLQNLSMPIIATVVYSIIEWLESIIDDKKFKKFLPFVACVLGGLIGLWIFYIEPSIINADNLGMSIIIGVVSGASATGIDQGIKKITEIKKDGGDQSD